MDGLISNLQRFSTKDGPGIRTTVFFKGCNLNCFWCHNPECISRKIEIQIFDSKCISCKKCIEICPKEAHSLENGTRIFHKEKCITCGKCVSACPSKALQLSGERITVEELIEKIDRDSPFYKSSGGGVTFSGGEPLLQKKYLLEALCKCKKKGYNTAIESSFNVPWETIESINGLVDLFIIDIKTKDSNIHKSVTGRNNEQILDNIKKLDSLANEIWIRTPIIPGVNDNVESIINISEFVKKLKNVTKVELMPFHKLAINKYRSLNMEYKAANLNTPSPQLMKLLNEILIKNSIVLY